MLELALLAFGAFALLYPKSPFTLAMLRQRGPRRDYALLLRGEIRESARGFATYALAAFVAAEAIHLVVRAGAPRPNTGNAPLVAIVTCAGVGTWLAWQSVRAWLTAALRTDAHEDGILHARFARSDAPADAPPGNGFDARGIAIPAPPAAGPADVEQLLGARVAVSMLTLGVAAAFGGAAMIAWTLSHPDETRGIGEPAILCAVGIALVALALRLDRAEVRRE